MPEQPSADWAGIWEETAFDAAGPDKEEQTPRWRGQERVVRAQLGGFRGLRAIEIGAGRGVNALLYAKRGADVTLLDIEEIALEQARELFDAHGVSFTPVLGDVFDLPEDVRGRFDVSMSFGLCEHFVGERRRRIVESHLAVLRPGGVAMIGVPNRLSPVYRLWKAVLTRRGSWIFGTEEPYTAGELASLGRAAGGEPLDPVYGSFAASIVNHGVNQLLFKLGRGGLPLPQRALPLVDRLAYELLLPLRKPE